MTKHKLENIMEKSKQKRLEAQGWKIGDAAEFLELTPEESAMVNIRLALSRSLKDRRQRSMTQTELATKIGSSQPRMAMAENGDASVSIELLIRSLLATGATVQEIGQIIATVG
jgi:DNA-binding XRE family transcriptional regulator